MAAAPRKSQSIIKILVLSVVGSLLIGAGFGYLVGNSSKVYQFSPQQTVFIDGVISGTKFKDQRAAWEEEGKKPDDPRSNPELRCAALYYPHSPLGMDGCLLALEGRPKGGYQLPMR